MNFRRQIETTKASDCSGLNTEEDELLIIRDITLRFLLSIYAHSVWFHPDVILNLLNLTTTEV